jgi:hypothetical protein
VAEEAAGIGAAACLTTWIGGRGRGSGTFCGSAVAAWADSTDAAVNVKQMLKRLRLVAFIQPRLIRGPGDPDSGKVANVWLARPNSLTNDTKNLRWRVS